MKFDALAVQRREEGTRWRGIDGRASVCDVGYIIERGSRRDRGRGREREWEGEGRGSVFQNDVDEDEAEIVEKRRERLVLEIERMKGRRN